MKMAKKTKASSKYSSRESTPSSTVHVDHAHAAEGASSQEKTKKKKPRAPRSKEGGFQKGTVICKTDCGMAGVGEMAGVCGMAGVSCISIVKRRPSTPSPCITGPGEQPISTLRQYLSENTGGALHLRNAPSDLIHQLHSMTARHDDRVERGSVAGPPAATPYVCSASQMASAESIQQAQSKEQTPRTPPCTPANTPYGSFNALKAFASSLQAPPPMLSKQPVGPTQVHSRAEWRRLRTRWRPRTVAGGGGRSSRRPARRYSRHADSEMPASACTPDTDTDALDSAPSAAKISHDAMPPGRVVWPAVGSPAVASDAETLKAPEQARDEAPAKVELELTVAVDKDDDDEYTVEHLKQAVESAVNAARRKIALAAMKSNLSVPKSDVCSCVRVLASVKEISECPSPASDLEESAETDKDNNDAAGAQSPPAQNPPEVFLDDSTDNADDKVVQPSFSQGDVHRCPLAGSSSPADRALKKQSSKPDGESVYAALRKVFPPSMLKAWNLHLPTLRSLEKKVQGAEDDASARTSGSESEDAEEARYIARQRKLVASLWQKWNLPLKGDETTDGAVSSESCQPQSTSSDTLNGVSSSSLIRSFPCPFNLLVDSKKDCRMAADIAQAKLFLSALLPTLHLILTREESTRRTKRKRRRRSKPRLWSQAKAGAEALARARAQAREKEEAELQAQEEKRAKREAVAKARMQAAALEVARAKGRAKAEESARAKERAKAEEGARAKERAKAEEAAARFAKSKLEAKMKGKAIARANACAESRMRALLQTRARKEKSAKSPKPPPWGVNSSTTDTEDSLTDPEEEEIVRRYTRTRKNTETMLRINERERQKSKKLLDTHLTSTASTDSDSKLKLKKRDTKSKKQVTVKVQKNTKDENPSKTKIPNNILTKLEATLKKQNIEKIEAARVKLKSDTETRAGNNTQCQDKSERKVEGGAKAQAQPKTQIQNQVSFKSEVEIIPKTRRSRSKRLKVQKSSNTGLSSDKSSSYLEVSISKTHIPPVTKISPTALPNPRKRSLPGIRSSQSGKIPLITSSSSKIESTSSPTLSERVSSRELFVASVSEHRSPPRSQNSSEAPEVPSAPETTKEVPKEKNLEKENGDTTTKSDVEPSSDQSSTDSPYFAVCLSDGNDKWALEVSRWHLTDAGELLLNCSLPLNEMESAIRMHVDAQKESSFAEKVSIGSAPNSSSMTVVNKLEKPIPEPPPNPPPTPSSTLSLISTTSLKERTSLFARTRPLAPGSQGPGTTIAATSPTTTTPASMPLNMMSPWTSTATFSSATVPPTPTFSTPTIVLQSLPPSPPQPPLQPPPPPPQPQSTPTVALLLPHAMMMALMTERSQNSPPPLTLESLAAPHTQPAQLVRVPGEPAAAPKIFVFGEHKSSAVQSRALEASQPAPQPADDNKTWFHCIPFTNLTERTDFLPGAWNTQ